MVKVQRLFAKTNLKIPVFAKGIAVGDTLLVDEFRDQKFNFMLANPPYGVDWKREYDSVSAEAEDKNSRFAPGLPDKAMVSYYSPCTCSIRWTPKAVV